MSIKKFTVEVVTTKEIQISIDTYKYDEKFIEGFSEYMWSIDCVNDIIEHIAIQAANYEGSFIEGVGEWPQGWKEDDNIRDFGYHVKVVDDSTEAEIKEKV